jgi:hypothetical protein
MGFLKVFAFVGVPQTSTLRCVGSIPALGQWDVTASLPLTYDACVGAFTAFVPDAGSECALFFLACFLHLLAEPRLPSTQRVPFNYVSYETQSPNAFRASQDDRVQADSA